MPITPHPDSLLAKRPDLIRHHKPIPRVVQQTPAVLYVLYENPSDYPGKFVLRRQRGMEVEKVPMRVSPSYLECLWILPRNARPLGSHPDQDPCIKDVWAVVA